MMTADATDKAKLLAKAYSQKNFEKSGQKPGNFTTNEILLTGALVAVLSISFISLQYFLPKARHCPFDKGYYNSTQLCTPQLLEDGSISFNFVTVTDLDHDSKHSEHSWRSFLKEGQLIFDEQDYKNVRVEWPSREKMLFSQIAASGRSMELSDLVVFDGNLLTVDDRTGIVYRIKDFTEVIPWVILNDGPGNTTKGFKAEWSTVKDGLLYVGGLGKEWTTTQGEFVNYYPMWIKVVTKFGEVAHLDWTENYKRLRREIGIEFPGYMIHESAQWSEIHSKWFFLPRRASKEIYTEADDEHRGTNVLLSANSDFSQITVRRVGKLTGERGFSAFQFLPGSNDNIIVALKSEERNGVPVASYLFVYRLSDDRILLDDTRFDGPHKFEGIAFV